MALNATLLTSGVDTTDQQTYTTASVTPAANRLLLLMVYTVDGANTIPTPTVTGNGLNWVQVSTIVWSTAANTNSRRITIYRAMGASPSTGAISIDAGRAVDGCIWSLSEWTGMDTSGTDGSGAIVQAATNKSEVAVSSLTVTLAAFGSVDNGAYGAFGLSGDDVDIVGEVGWTELSDAGLATPTNRGQCMWRADNDITPSASWSVTTRCGGIGVEIKAAAAAVRKDLLLLGVGV